MTFWNSRSCSISILESNFILLSISLSPKSPPLIVLSSSRYGSIELASIELGRAASASSRAFLRCLYARVNPVIRAIQGPNEAVSAATDVADLTFIVVKNASSPAFPLKDATVNKVIAFIPTYNPFTICATPVARYITADAKRVTGPIAAAIAIASNRNFFCASVRVFQC